MTDKATLTITLRDWQHEEFKRTASQYSTSINRLVLSIAEGKQYDFRGVEIYPSKSNRHVNVTGNPELIQRLRAEAEVNKMSASAHIRAMSFGSLGEAGKIVPTRTLRTHPLTSYLHITMREGEYQAVKVYAALEGLAMSDVTHKLLEGKLPPLHALSDNGAKRWQKIGIRVTEERLLELRLASVEAGMRFPTYLRSLMFVGVKDNQQAR